MAAVWSISGISATGNQWRWLNPRVIKGASRGSINAIPGESTLFNMT